MGSQIKRKIAQNVFETLQTKINLGNFNDVYGRLYVLRSAPKYATVKVLLPRESNNLFDQQSFLNSQLELFDRKTVKNVIFNDMSHQNFLELELDLKHFIKDVLESDSTKLNFKSLMEKVVVEFSSPNIAKPFHVGHLRSTIIGNSLANVNKKFGNDVVKLNYLGDWGTQFGMIQLGMNLENYSEEDLKKNPLKILYQAYVKGNSEAEKNHELYEKAKNIFLDLESGKEEITLLWEKYRNWTTAELNAVYSRLGVVFDEFSWESDYKRIKADRILKMLEEKGILSIDEKDRTVATSGEKVIPLLKSDGTSLYLLRDLMAVEERRSKHKFDVMYYVVENGQTEHFCSLFDLCSKLNLDEGVKLEHVKFGRIRGMSTRKGKVIFLSDVLDEAKDRIYQKQLESKNTKVTLENKDSADILGVSIVIMSDLRQRRLRDYDFSWENNIKFFGDNGVIVQYCHSRLCNLEIESGCTAAAECDPEALLEPEAVNLILTIARYDESLWSFLERREPCALVSYIFGLVKDINSAYKRLNVKNSDSHVSSQRLLLFNRSREVLNDAMKLLGMKPLSRM